MTTVSIPTPLRIGMSPQSVSHNMLLTESRASSGVGTQRSLIPASALLSELRLNWPCTQRSLHSRSNAMQNRREP